MVKKPTLVYQIKITLDHTHPPIWRRILAPANTTLLKLHDILQIVMGWEDYHLHMFTINGTIYSNPANDEYGQMDTEDEGSYKLSQVITQKGQKFKYEYDFGDSWHHTLLVEKILPSQAGVHYPLCLAGKHACPPEDVGGVWGYMNFLEAIRDPSHPDHETYLEWAGEDFDPELFHLEEINTNLRNMGRGRSTEAANHWFIEELDQVEKNIDLRSHWAETLPDDQQSITEALPLRRDVLVLLTYLRDNKVTGTASTGNLPLKAVREICAQFVNPPSLEEVIGTYVFRVRSENDVWPLYFVHVLASVGELAAGGLGRRWVLTDLGQRFLAAPAPQQVWYLFSTWWTKINWAIADPSSMNDFYMQNGFPRLILKNLRDLPVEELHPFEPFADQQFAGANMGFPARDQGKSPDVPAQYRRARGNQAADDFWITTNGKRAAQDTRSRISSTGRLPGHTLRQRSFGCNERSNKWAAMKALAAREEKVWQEVETLLDTGRKIASVYEQATAMLEELEQLSKFQDTLEGFLARLQQLAQKYLTRPSLVRRWKDLGWM